MSTPFVLQAGDFFCGAGGGTSGLMEACVELGFDVEMVAVNHNETAIKTHQTNHRKVKHFCEKMETLWPLAIVPSGKLHIGIFAPECTNHSNARGAKPINDQSRATAWCVVRFVEMVDTDVIIVENIPEFMDWGPIHPMDHPDPKKRGRPIKEKKGLYFNNWVRNLKLRGYKVDYKILNAANFGAATARKRFFLIGKKTGKPITWPAETHAGQPTVTRSGRTIHRFKSAAECIHWDVPGKSIYGRKKPLVPNTMRRIYAGVEKFSGLPFLLPLEGVHGGNVPRDLDEPFHTFTTRGGGGLCTPFLVVLRNNADARSLDEPMPSLCADGQHVGLALPYIVNMKGKSNAADIHAPAPSITAGAKHLGVAQPYIIPVTHQGGPNRCHDIETPMPCITGARRGELGLVSPFIVTVTHSQSKTSPRSVDDPLGVITTAKGGEFALACPYIIPQFSGQGPRSVDAPLNTITTQSRGIGLAQPFIIPYRGERDGQAPRGHGVNEPMPTICTNNGHALVTPYLVKYNGTGGAVSVQEPMPTVTTKDRFGLVHPQFIEFAESVGEVVGYLDILYRMLLDVELAAAMGFPKTYFFAGNVEDRVRQIGNAIVVDVMKALCMEVLKDYVPEKAPEVKREKTAT